MKLSVCREGVEIGEWSERKVRRLFAEGQLNANDYFWREGMLEWLPLSDLVDSNQLTHSTMPGVASEHSNESSLLAALQKCEAEETEEKVRYVPEEANPLSPADKGVMHGLIGLGSLASGLGFRSLFQGDIGGFVAGQIIAAFFFLLRFIFSWFVRRK